MCCSQVVLEADRGCCAPFRFVNEVVIACRRFWVRFLLGACGTFLRELLSTGCVKIGAIAQVSPQQLGACLLGKTKGLNSFYAGPSWAEGLWPDDSPRPYV